MVFSATMVILIALVGIYELIEKVLDNRQELKEEELRIKMKELKIKEKEIELKEQCVQKGDN